MKPYSLSPDKHDDIGCCPGHDWPRTRRFSGYYSSAAHKRASSKKNRIAKRNRRHRDKNKLNLQKKQIELDEGTV